MVGLKQAENVSTCVARAQATTGKNKALELLTTRTVALTPYTTVSVVIEAEDMVVLKARRETVLGLLCAVAKMATLGLPK